ncbi:putative long tail fiber, proximal subunit [Escherichia phage vB_EcoM_G50]|uniref:Putative long tail fiber, proximal subunit n=1 Tax=Escherichia phage vB_EcoM_G50 TaxID=2502303 RepID=A0A482GQP7_9CAUD|nr:tail fiber protein proximal subunit [Escherichia phage vB_EcoM_G50]QBO65115.1 putative long tail fiber, proximal subunit [Escherichia phage vB_EcoM_G50]
MAEIKRKFRAEDGLDAGGDKIINVALADRTVGTDGVNVDYLIQENTVQQYDPTRGYLKDFVIIYDNRFWAAINDIPKPAGTFNSGRWRALRTDANWITVSSGSYQLKSGEAISVNTAAGNDITFTLPSSPIDGDTIVLQDIGGKPGVNQVLIVAPVQSIVNFRGEQVRSVLMTHPKSQLVLIFSNRLWQMYVADYSREAVIATPANTYQAQSNDFIVRRFTSAAPINIKLPRFANHGDIINFVDLDKLNPLYHTIVTTYDETTSVQEDGTHSIEGRTSIDGFLMYDDNEKLWRLFDGDSKARLRIITTNSNIRPNEEVMVFGANNGITQTIELQLPTNISVGDTVKISMNYMRKGQTVKIKAAGEDKIASSVQLLQFPKRSEYPPEAEWVTVQELVFNGETNYVPVLQLAYIEDSDGKYWVVQQNVPTVERVDSLNDSTRARLGVIALATQAQANVDLENSPQKELAITPETLANRTATETRRGIARIATTAQVNQNTTFSFADDIIITPKKLNERTATETRRGVAEIATQQETNAGTDDTTIITPKKLQARQGSESLSGIVTFVSTTGATPASSRELNGTNVYNKNTNNLVVSPKALDQYKATPTQQGAVILAVESEVIAGQSQEGWANAVVTPETLHKKTSTDGRIGLIEIATQSEVNTGTDYTRAVTPKTLNDRIATESLSGIAEIATQVEFDAGVDDTRISTPLKIKTRFNSTDRTSVVALSGLVESGTLWDHYTLNILEANETQRGTLRVATQVEAAAGTLDNVLITPKKLLGTKSTESQEGVIKVATQSETVTGTSANTAVSPKNLKWIVQSEPTWAATTAIRGFVKTSSGSITFVGNDTVGSTQSLELYEKNSYAVSPYELNRVLANYLPLKAKAADANLLDGLDSSQFIRRDIAQTVNGSLTLTQQTNLSAPLVSSSTATFGGSVSANSTLTISNTGTATRLIFEKGPQTGTNPVQTMTIRVWGNQFGGGSDTTRSTVFEVGDETSNHFYSQRNKAGNITFSINGTVMPINVNASGSLNANGVATFGSSVTANGEFISKSANAFRAISGNYGFFIRNDAANTYFMLTASGDQTGGFNGLRPLAINNASGQVTIGESLIIAKGATINSGGLTVNSRIRSQGTKTSDLYTRAPTSDTVGFWSIDINDSATYNQFPGYFKMVEKTNEVTGLPYLERGEEVKSPGTLTQFGNTLDSLYQDWITYPTTPEARTTRWTRTWQKTKNSWSSFVQVFDGGNPPQPSDIGALPSDNATMGNLTIRDFLRIGNVRIIPDPVNKTVKFEWVE